jgi:hypothetical protein
MNSQGVRGWDLPLGSWHAEGHAGIDTIIPCLTPACNHCLRMLPVEHCGSMLATLCAQNLAFQPGMQSAGHLQSPNAPPIAARIPFTPR